MSTEELFLPMVKANELCERAVRWRRSLVTDPLVSHQDLQHLIRYSIPRRNLRPDADGWIQISNLTDGIVGRQAMIIWHPPTDHVRLVWSKR